jgi:hypothetical protein
MAPLTLRSFSTTELPKPTDLIATLRDIVEAINHNQSSVSNVTNAVTNLTQQVTRVTLQPATPPAPIGPFPSVVVNAALDGNGTAISPINVRVDGTTVTINGSNQLEVPASAAFISGTLTTPRVPYATGAHVLSDNAAMHWDNTNARLIISTNGQTLDAIGAESCQIQIGGDFDSGTGLGNANLTADSYGNVSTFTFRRADGTQASKSALGASSVFLNFRAQGWDGSAYSNGGLFRFQTNGAWTGSNHGTDFTISLTPNAAVTAPTVKVRVTGAGEGAVGIGTEGLVSIDTALVVRRANPPDIGYVAKFYSNLTCYLQIRSGTGANEQAGFSLWQNTNAKEWRVAVIGNDENALRIAGGSGGADIKAYITQNGNLLLNDSNVDPATGTKCLIFGDGTAPATLDSNSCGLYGNDVGGTVNVFGINEAGEVTQLTGGIGYPTGQGGTVTQLTNKATGVTLSKYTGEITLNNATLNADTTVSFTLTNTKIAAGDVLVLNHASGGTIGSYLLEAACAAGSAVIYVRNITTGNLGEAIVIRFAVVRGATA